jgi:heme exporter protein B|tara:strand:+ start:354 stop:1028 length:675 start_codon:yes stop_codon:yes gene_type:complete
MHIFSSIKALLKREFLITYRNYSDVLSILTFFLLAIIIFVFSVGPNNEIFNEIGIGIIWTLILLSNTLSSKRFFQNDFDNNNIVLFHMSGLSYEMIVIIKIISVWLFFQIPFFIVIPIASIFLNIDFINIKTIFFSVVIGSTIITCITAISSSMNLLNKKNFTIGSLIIMIFSIPVIIFSVNLNNVSLEIANIQLKILLGIMFFFFSFTPWVSASCIRLGLQNK